MEKILTDKLPTDGQLGEIEAVWLVDDVVGENPIGEGEMTVLAVGETERGLFTPQRVLGAEDRFAKYGRLGWPTSEGPYRGAVALQSGGNTPWNGNLYTYLANYRFSRLVVCRVDNSAGRVTFRRHAALRGGKGPFTVAAGATVTLQRNGVTNVVTTWTAGKASILGVGGTYPTLFVGGETLLLQIDGDAVKTVTMTSAEQALADVVARINAVMAATVASADGGELRISSVIEGKAGRVRIIGGTALATLGLSATPVHDLWTITIVTASTGVYTIAGSLYVAGALVPFTATYTATVPPDTTTVIRDDLLADFVGVGVAGLTFTSVGAAQITVEGDDNVMLVSLAVTAEPNPGDATAVNTTPGQPSDVSGTGVVNNVASISAAEASTVYALGANIASYVDAEGYLWVANSADPSTGTLQATAGEYAAFGFSTTVASAASATDITIPSGTRVQDSTTGTTWVVMGKPGTGEELKTGTGGGGFDLLVRPWDDTDSALPSLAAGIDTVVTADMPTGYWSVTNASAVTRLSATQLDARYKAALDRTLDQSAPSAVARVLVSARTSANIDTFCLANATAAGESAGLSGRRFIGGPIPGTSIDDATAEAGVGVGIARSHRRIYCFPGIRKRIDEILQVGAAGGLGFSDDGVIDTPASGLYAMMRAKMPAEKSVAELPNSSEVGPLTNYGVVGIETAYDSTLGGTALTSESYKLFKASGIVGIRRQIGIGYFFQSDVTSVNRLVEPSRVNPSRGFLFDELADQFYLIGLTYKAKLTRPGEISALLSQTRRYLQDLASPSQPERARIRTFAVTNESTPAQIGKGWVILKTVIGRFSHIEAIVFHTQITTDNGVSVEEAA